MKYPTMRFVFDRKKVATKTEVKAEEKVSKPVKSVTVKKPVAKKTAGGRLKKAGK